LKHADALHKKKKISLEAALTLTKSAFWNDSISQLENLCIETVTRYLRRDSRFPKDQGWELHLAADGTQIYFNVHTNKLHVCLRGG
jgi:hypothetical protein